MRKRESTVKENQDGPPKPEMENEQQEVNERDGSANVEKTFVQRAVQVGLITIPLAIYLSWAYKKFFPCPRVKCKPQPKPKGKRKIKSSSKTRIPLVCSMLEFTMKRYCTNRANAKQGLVGNSYCDCRHVQKPPRHEDPCEMLRYDVRDESYDRGASERNKNPFAAFYEDDFRDEVDASRQEQAYTKERYRERRRVPERKGRVFKGKVTEKQQNDNSKNAPGEETSEECESAEVQTKLQQGTGTHTQNELNTLAEGTPTKNMTYCEYLKQPILDYDTQEYPQTETNLKNNPKEPKGKQSPTTALVVYSSQLQPEDHVCSDGESEEEDPIVSKHLKTSPTFNITPEVMDSLCEQYSREYRKSLLELEKNVKQDIVEHNEGNPNTDEMKPRECSGENSNSTTGESKTIEQKYDSAEDVCSDKYIEQIFNRYKTQSVEKKQEISKGENDFETVGSTKLKPDDDLCDANFHSKNSDTPYVVKVYTCKTTKSLKSNNYAKEDKAEEDFESRQNSFWHSCNPPKGIKKGCQSSPKSKGPYDD